MNYSCYDNEMNLQITLTFLSRWSVCYRVPTWGPSVCRACWSRVPQTHFWLVGGSGLWVKINTDILILIAGAQWDSCCDTQGWVTTLPTYLGQPVKCTESERVGGQWSVTALLADQQSGLPCFHGPLQQVRLFGGLIWEQLALFQCVLTGLFCVRDGTRISGQVVHDG